MNLRTKEAARATGDKFYFTGAPCKRGHVAERFVSCSGCCECSKEKSKQWYSDKERSRQKTASWRARNKERDKSSRRKWLDANKDRVREKAKEWDANNPGKRLAINRSWYRRNAEAQRLRAVEKREAKIEYYRENTRRYNAVHKAELAANARNRRARQKNNGGRHSADDIRDILSAQRGRCACCRANLSEDYHVDHIIPIARGGGNDRRNLQVLCAPCNQTKSAKDPIEFMRQRGMLL